MSEQRVKRHHIVCLDSEGVAPSVKVPDFSFPHTWASHGYTSQDQLIERLEDATIAMTFSVPLRAGHLSRLPALKMISLALTGTDIVDLDYCHEHGIVVTNVPGYAANTVTEHVLAVMFELLRKPGGYHRLLQRVHRGEVPPRHIYFDFRIRDVAGRTLGVIGHGAIAQHLAARARGLGMKVLFYDRQGGYRGPDYLPLDELLAVSDVVSVHVPLTPETRDLIGRRELSLMKQDAILINTARGGIVNEAALIQAMTEGKLGGAALDVAEHEPLRPDDPLMSLLDRGDFILTPHVAWSSEDAMQGLVDQAARNITQFALGEVPEFSILPIRPAESGG